MHSEVRVKTDSLKLYLSLGLCATGLIIFLSIWFSFEFSVILLSIAGVVSLVGVIGAWGKFESIRYGRQLSRINVEIQRQELRIKTAEADKAVLMSGIFTFPRTDRALLMSGNDMRLIEAMTGGGNGDVIQPLAVPAGQIELLPLLDRAERVLVKGASDAGKTTIFQHVASRSSGVIIVDPHYAPGIWPDGVQVIGGGRDYGKIEAFFGWLSDEMDSRYKRRAAGDSNFQPLTVIIDEFMSINAECGSAGKIISAMIRESRKVGFRLFVGSHSELVKPLGLEGAGDVREGLLIVRLYYSQIRQERRATVDAGEGEQPCIFPPYYGGGPMVGADVVIPDLVVPPSADKQDAEFARLVNGGMSRNAAAWQVYGRGYAGDLVGRGRRALGEI